MGKIHPKKKLRVNYATAIAKKARARPVLSLHNCAASPALR